jgi:flagellar hook-associated protein 1 FlgK
MSAGITSINSLGLAGMQAAQTGLANIATNVSGASVEGFHRREVHPLMISASTSPLVQGGTVIIDSMVRSYSALVSTQYLANHAKVKQTQSLNAAAQIVDRMLVDESSGLTAVLNGFFTASADLSADPASGTARTAFATTSGEIADRIRNLAATIEETRRQALFQLEGVVASVNEKAEALARVNLLIRGSSAYGKPLPSADLLDERDRLSGQLSDLVGASIETSDLGEATLRFDGVTLVQGGQSARLRLRVESGTGLPTGMFDVSIPRGDGNPNQSFASVTTLRGGGIVQGEFGGLTRYAEGAESWLQRLDEIAMNLVRVGDPLRGNPPQQWYSNVEDVSGDPPTLKKVGTNDVGLDGEDVFFNGVFRVKAFLNNDGSFVNPNPENASPREFVRSLRPSLTLYSNMTSGDMVPWAKAAEPDPDPPSPGGSADQSFAIGLAGMRATTSREWSEWVSRVSADMSGWRAEEAAFTSVDTSLREQREQISGVDLDEEATNLLRFQQIYQANSAVIQAAMRMFDVMLSQATR